MCVDVRKGRSRGVGQWQQRRPGRAGMDITMSISITELRREHMSRQGEVAARPSVHCEAVASASSLVVIQAD